jgi:hypothetical protein
MIHAAAEKFARTIPIEPYSQSELKVAVMDVLAMALLWDPLADG